jgi:hypothetical protein
MRRNLLIAAFLLAAPAAAEAPALAPAKLTVFASGWSPGEWKQTEPGSTSSERMCVSRVEQMLVPARVSLASCRLTVVQNTADRAAFTYACPTGNLGRTDIRRDAEGVYVVVAQGIDGGLPFEMRGEFRRLGACTQISTR